MLEWRFSQRRCWGLGTGGCLAQLVLPGVSKVCNAFETSRNDNPVTQRDTLKAICPSATLLMFPSPRRSTPQPSLVPAEPSWFSLCCCLAVAVSICGIMFRLVPREEP
jgi:hypothetical protein